jgi:hypothetical protein
MAHGRYEVPRTEIVQAGPHWDSLVESSDVPSEFARGVFKRLCDEIWNAIVRMAVGCPVFLRTGQGSGKHEWKRTCYLANPNAIPDHVSALVQWSDSAGVMGLPWDVWAVREMLPTSPVLTCEAYGGMPLAKEYRAFVRGGVVECLHPYWPLEAIRKGNYCTHRDDAGKLAMDFPAVCSVCNDAASKAHAELSTLTPAERFELDVIAGAVAKRFDGRGDGYWSVDLLLTANGWFVIDMAQCRFSHHDPACKRPVWGNPLTAAAKAVEIADAIDAVPR